MSENLPKAYKQGWQEFYGRRFLVSREVLIPRPETEMIIDAVLNLTGKAYLPGVKPNKAVLSQDLTIVDVGTGSGCIAITLKLELPKSKVIASDVSLKVIEIAKKNAKNLGAEVEFIKSDLMDDVEFLPDIVVANLPYVDKTWDWLDMERLKYEPEIALFAEQHGLALIFKLIEQVGKSKAKYLVLEADPCQHLQIIEQAEKNGLELAETRGFILTFSNNLQV